MYFAGGVKEKYTFIKSRLNRYTITRLCSILDINGAWLKCHQSKREQDDNRLLDKIKQYWIESGFVYGHRNITLDLKDEGETCGKNRVYRIMKAAGITSLRGYKRHRGFSCGKIHHVANNILDREFQSQSRINTGSLVLPIFALIKAGCS